jgi:hypothetical protein
MKRGAPERRGLTTLTRYEKLLTSATLHLTRAAVAVTGCTYLVPGGSQQRVHSLCEIQFLASLGYA